MGQDMTLYRMPRFKDAVPSDVLYVETLIEYEEGKLDWVEEHYPNFNAYWKDNYDYPIPSSDVVDFYRGKYKTFEDEDGYKYHGIMERVYWSCGRGSNVHDWFMTELDTSSGDGGFYPEEVTPEILTKVAADVIDYFNGIKFQSVEITGSYIDKGDSIEVTPCDGVEFDFEDGHMGRVANEYSSEYFLYAENGIDETWFARYTGLLTAIGKILRETDFEDYAIFYEASW